MIKARIGLHNIESSVDRPVLIRVVEDVRKFLGFSNSVYYNIDENDLVDKEKNKIGDIESYSSPRTEEIVITHTEDIEEDTELSLVTINPDYQDIYVDNDIGASFRPLHVVKKHIITFKYFNKSKSKVNNLINRLRVKPTSSDWTIIHNLEYSYILPGYLSNLLIEINTLKNTRLVTPVDLNQYINNTFDRRVDMVNPEDGDTKKVDIGIKEKQHNVLGHITSPLGNIKKEYDEEKGSWYVEFEYSFSYETPIQLLAKYPIMIYNNLIDKKYREVLSLTKPTTCSTAVYNKGTAGLMDISKAKISQYLTIPKNSYYKNIPEDDNFVAPKPDPYTVRILSILTIVSDADKTDLFNINDIPNIKFKDTILDFMKTEFQYMSRPYESIFFFELFRNGVKDYKNKIIADADLNLRTEFEMDMKSTYRVMINATVDLNILKPANLKRIEDYVLAVQATLPDSELVPLVDYFLELLDVQELTPLKKKTHCDLQYILSLDNNAWHKYYTVQTTMILAGVLEAK
jgi:hypothetical protein